MVKLKHDVSLTDLEDFELGFLIPKPRLIFTELRQAFVKAPIIHYFDLKCHIGIKTNKSSHVIGGVLT